MFNYFLKIDFAVRIEWVKLNASSILRLQHFHIRAEFYKKVNVERLSQTTKLLLDEDWAYEKFLLIDDNHTVNDPGYYGAVCIIYLAMVVLI